MKNITSKMIKLGIILLISMSANAGNVKEKTMSKSIKTIIKTNQAPEAIGTYSQAVKVGNTVYFSGQIPLVPSTMKMIDGGIEQQIHQVFKNLQAVAQAAGGSLADMVKLNVYLTDLTHFPMINTIMAQYFSEPYPARAAIGVAALPRGAEVEIEGVMVLSE